MKAKYNGGIISDNANIKPYATAIVVLLLLHFEI